MRDELAAADAQAARDGELAVLGRLRREVLARRIARVDLEGVAHEDVAARAVDVAADGHEVAHRQVQRHGAYLLVEREPPLDGGVVAARVQAGRTHDVLFGQPADGRRPGRGHVAHAFPQLVDAAGPAVHELMVVQVLGNDDVQPGARQRRVGSGPQLQMIGRTRAPPGEARVDGDDARPHLHALHQPVAYVAVGVRGERLVAPHDDHLGRAVGGIGVAQLVRHGGVGYGEVAQGRHGTADARHVAGEPGEEQRGDVRRLQGGLAEQGHQPVDVAARAMHAHDGLGAVFLADGLDLFFYEVVRLVPRDALELRRVAAVFARTLHGVQHPVGVVHDFGQIQAAHAQLAVREGAQGIALHMVQLAVLGVEQNAAAVMAAGRRILVGARDGEAVLLPRELAFVVGGTVEAVQEFLIVCHCSSLSFSRWRSSVHRTSPS